MSAVLSTVSHFIQLLQEDDAHLQNLAVDRLLGLVDTHWPEISNILPTLESLFEGSFPDKPKLAFLISKVFYHLEDYTESIFFALESKAYFDLKHKSTFTDCILSKGLDLYVQEKQAQYLDPSKQIDPLLENFFERVFAISLEQRTFKAALGVCLEARRLDKIKEIFSQNATEDLLNYLYELVMKYSSNQSFKRSVVNFMVNLYKNKKLEPHEYIHFCQCSYYLNDYTTMANTLCNLIQTEKQISVLLAFQIAQDLQENENKFFCEKVIEHVKPYKTNQIPDDKVVNHQPFDHLISILNGNFAQKQHMKFLIDNNKADKPYILLMKEKVDPKQSISHSAVIFANALQQAGTLDDSFIREQLDWEGKVTHWAKFNLIASLGVIHQNNVSNAMTLLKPYLPNPTAQPKNHEAGGSLMALGFINQKTKDQEVINFLVDQIKTQNAHEVVIHGSCQGLGLVGLGSEDMMIYEELKNVLFTNQAVSGEAAGMGIGLVMAGSQNRDIFEELLAYQKETDHEKIIRAISLAQAAMCFGNDDRADASIDKLLEEQDAIIRQGGAFAIGMAYCGTASARAVKKLLHIISTDVSDDVKRAAVISLGFVYVNNHQQLPKILSLLVQSYNAHIRYGAVLALGIAGAGKGHQESLKMVQPMLNDNVDFVRQGAMIAASLILQQMTEHMDAQAKKLKTDLQDVWSKKQEGPLCRLGALLGAGISQPGGRNSVVTLASKSGNLKLGACVGMLYFCHYWYWFTSVHFLSLSLSPSGFVGVDKDLDVPETVNFQSNSKPSHYGYPDNYDPSKDQQKKNTQKITLSTTTRTQRRSLLRKVEKEPEPEQKIEEEKPEEKKEEEPNQYVLKNPCRILEKQQSVVTFTQGRYRPIIKNRARGIVFLIDSTPEEKEKEKQLRLAQQDPELAKIEEEPNIPDDFVFEEPQETDQLLK